MKKTLILLLGISLFSCNPKCKSKQGTENKKTELNTKTENFDWLLGKWRRNNEEPGKKPSKIGKKSVVQNIMELDLPCKTATLLNKKKLNSFIRTKSGI